MKKLLITGGCGFIGSHFAIQQIAHGNFVVNLDKITYAANIDNVASIANHPNYRFVQGDICDQQLVAKILNDFAIDNVVNFAAETHVDNSIASADAFIQTNVNGTFSLLQAAKQYKYHENFRFLHVSTDEVFGSLQDGDEPFNEESNYRPNSPYSASKAASDHLVRAWHETYKLPTIITNCSNNFGKNQHQEKFIPTIIRSALALKDIPIYGNGKNIRDWIFVDDHCAGIYLALQKGKIGESYCFGGNAEFRNIEIATMICEILDAKKPRKDKISYKSQLKFVQDRAGHDYRYAISNNKAQKQLGFNINNNFKAHLESIPNLIQTTDLLAI